MRQSENALRWALTISLFLLVSAFCKAQIPSRSNTTSTPVPGVGHDYLQMFNETVNPANGSLSIRIGVPIPPSRGLTVPFNFAYDSNGAFYLTSPNVNGIAWDTSKARLSQGGWSYSAPMLSVQENTYYGEDDQGKQVTCNALINFVMQDADGNRHNLGLTYFSSNTFCNMGQEEGPVTSAQEGPILAETASNWGGINAVNVTDGDGTLYYFLPHTPRPNPGSCFDPCVPTTYPPAFISDRNGNTVNVFSTAAPGGPVLQYADSIGRTALNIPTFGSNPDSVTVSGLSNPYQVYWTTVQANYGANFVHVNDGSYTCGTPSGGQRSISAISEIVLPNGQAFTFSYDPTYGMVNKITYPTGGYVRYVWGPNPQSDMVSGKTEPQQGFFSNCDYYYDNPAILHRYVSYDGVHEVLQQDSIYSTTWGISGNPYDFWSQKKTTVTTSDLVTGTQYSTVYTYNFVDADYQPNSSGFTPQIPVENSVQYYRDTNTAGTPLRTVAKQWSNERTLTQQRTTVDGGVMSETDWTYDPNGNEQVIEQDAYDYGSGTHGALLRKTATSYWNFGSTHIVDRPQKVVVSDASKNLAESDYTYDAVGDMLSETDKCFVITTSQGCTVGDALTSYAYADGYGHPTSKIDPGGHTTQYSYTDNFSDVSGTNTSAYLTKITYPQTNGVSHIETFSYAYSDGQLTQSVDQNLHPTNYFYSDPLRRLTEVDVPTDSGGTTISKKIDYVDANPPTTTTSTITTTQYATPDPNIISLETLDGMGHATQTQLTSDPEGADITDTAYDGLGRVYSVSNPHRSGAPSPTDGTTYTTYDALGRTTTVTKQDGNTVQTDYSAFPTVTVTDETGRKRQSKEDALGRVINVWEDPAGLNYETDYSYDSIGNLLSVNQLGDRSAPRTRGFSYDSLSRLLTAQNPESGTITYGYAADANCNPGGEELHTKTDARGITTTYCYDPLHRLTVKSYNDGATDQALYYYDESSIWGVAPQNGIGRLTHSQTSGNANIFSYDAMGRSIQQWPCLPSICGYGSYPFTVGYDLAGHMTSLTYPSGRDISESYTAAGRLLNVNFASFGGTSVNYTYYAVDQGTTPNTWGYDPNGMAKQFGYGNGAWQLQYGNSRLQLVTTAVGGLGAVFFNRANNFYDSNSHNNGNVMWINDNLNQNRTQGYQYDQLNRLTAGWQTDQAFNQTFSPDPWGNLKQSGTAAFTPNFDGNNRISQTGYSYDSGGDLLSDTFHTYAYDAESRIKTVDSGVTYTYDADGNRVRKDVSGSDPTEYIYFQGQPIAEHDPTTGDWSDYIFANGKRIAKSDNYVYRLHTHGTRCSNCGWQWISFDFSNSWSNGQPYAIQSGDRLYFRQWQSSTGQGGMVLFFSDGTNSAWNVNDNSGQPLNSASAQNVWLERNTDLSSFAGKSISTLSLMTDGNTQPGTWDEYYEDIALVSADGTVHPVYTFEKTHNITGTTNGGGDTGVSYLVDAFGGAGTDALENTYYYHEDHLGTSRLMTSFSGWPVWQGTFLPYGQEWNPQLTTNHYKFTGKERDAESSLDYFGARYYSSTMGRWMSPDWADKPEPVPYADPSDPQSLNLYGYVRNNPMSKADADGHCCDIADLPTFVRTVAFLARPIIALVGGTAAAGGAVVASATALIVKTTDAYVANQNDKAVLAATESQVAVENAQKLNSPEPGPAQTTTDKPGEVYVTDPQQSGKEYVGRTTQGTDKRMDTRADGRTGEAKVVDTYKTKEEGRYKEQKAMDERGGKQNLDNKRNEVAPDKMKKLNEKYGNNQ